MTLLFPLLRTDIVRWDWCQLCSGVQARSGLLEQQVDFGMKFAREAEVVGGAGTGLCLEAVAVDKAITLPLLGLQASMAGMKTLNEEYRLIRGNSSTGAA
jgi:hypothetical protein